MILPYFGIKKLPFPKEIKSDQMFESFDIREVSTALGYVRQHRGILLLTGEPGSGKTSILRRFVESLNPQTHIHCYTPHATVSRSELYRQINSLLGLPPKIRKCDLFEQIQRAVLELYSNQGKTPVFILDECQLMDTATLQELILITNFEMDSRLPFILILIGQPELRETLRRRIHEPLNQRITLRYHMAGLSVEETAAYIKHGLKLAGRTDPLFEENAFSVLHQLGHGLPRKIATYAIDAMRIGMRDKSQSITSEHVMQAAAASG